MKQLIGIMFASAVMMAAPSVMAAQLVMFEQAGCSWCEQWNADVGVVYHKTMEGKRAPLRRVSIHRQLPGDLKRVKPGRYTPTFVLVDNGREIGRIRGYPGEDLFWGLLGQILDQLPPERATSG